MIVLVYRICWNRAITLVPSFHIFLYVRMIFKDEGVITPESQPERSRLSCLLIIDTAIDKSGKGSSAVPCIPVFVIVRNSYRPPTVSWLLVDTWVVLRGKKSSQRKSSWSWEYNRELKNTTPIKLTWLQVLRLNLQSLAKVTLFPEPNMHSSFPLPF